VDAEPIIVGAGVAGLSCARELAALGLRPRVLDKARGVGGRCATRRVDGQPVDHGSAFLHGSDPEFLLAVDAVGEIDGVTGLPGWPRRVEGSGTPCRPEAFRPLERRAAFAEGLSVFAKHLARGLDIRLETRVASLRLQEGSIVVEGGRGASIEARDVVVALPVEQTRELLAPVREGGRDLEAVTRLLGQVGTLPCLTVIAGYPLSVPAPEWDLALPGSSRVVHLISHDSAKRPAPRCRVLVIQAHPHWSRVHLEADPSSWGAAMVEEAGRLLGPWAASPEWTQAHRWRYARVDRGAELAAPMIVTLPGGARLGLAGEVFSPGGGLEAAWLSGRRLARRLTGGTS
jgi:renalase